MSPAKKYFTKLFTKAMCLILLSLSALLSISGCKEKSAPESTSPAKGLDIVSLPIILQENAPPNTVKAAEYLASVLEKISGVRPDVIRSLPDPLPSQAIWVGYQPVLDKLFPGADFTLKNPEEIFLISNENHVAITGRDMWDPKHPSYPGRRFTIENWQYESGTANAVFTFLQDHIGVRWLFPGELGTDYPSKQSLKLKPFTHRYHPQLRARAGVFHQLALGYIKEDDAQRWAIHQRVLLHSLEFNGGHYFKNWWEKYGQTRNELFALQPDGTRGTFPANKEHRKICEGEPLVWQTWLEENVEHLAQYPHESVLTAMPNDSYFQGHCIDPRSRAWDPDPSETDVRIRLLWANGYSEEWPPLSDRYVTFANTLAEMVEKRFPGKNLLVATNAYGDVGRPLPVRARPRDNVLIISVANFPMRHPKHREASMREFSNWAGISNHIIFRPNLGNQAGLQWGLPDVPFHEAMEDMRFVADHGAIGVFFDMFFEHWANLAPYYYLVSQLAWNPYANGDAILDDYFKRCYGPAYPAMKDYWLFIEKTRQSLVHGIESNFRMMKVHEYFTSDVFSQAENYLREAEKLASTPGVEEKFAKRVSFTKGGLQYTKRIVEIRSLMEKYENRKLKDEQLKSEILGKWDSLTKFLATLPEYSVNANRMKPVEQNRRITGLHPDKPISGKMLRSISHSGLDLD